MNNIKKLDLLKGEIEEIRILDFLNCNNYLDCQFKKLKPYHILDFKSDDKKKYVEVKSRNNKHNKYKTTMIGYNKILKAEDKFNKGKQIYFIFVFFDGDYIIKYEPDKFKKYEVKRGGRWDRNKYEVKDYVYIPVEDLNKII